eukprot:1150577-Pelagomonas_calceolata.AAC.5
MHQHFSTCAAAPQHGQNTKRCHPTCMDSSCRAPCVSTNPKVGQPKSNTTLPPHLHGQRLQPVSPHAYGSHVQLLQGGQGDNQAGQMLRAVALEVIQAHIQLRQCVMTFQALHKFVCGRGIQKKWLAAQQGSRPAAAPHGALPHHWERF